MIPVAYQLTDEQGAAFDNEVRTGFTSDLSEGGLSLRLCGLPERLSTKALDEAAGTRVTIDIALPKHRLRLPCRVAWAKSESDDESDGASYCLGVEFVDVPPGDRQAIAAYARKCARRPKIRRALLAGAGVLLLSVTALLFVAHSRDESALARAAADAASARDGLMSEKQQVARVLEELSWLVANIEEIDDLVREFEPGASSNLPDGLAEGVYDLRKSVIRLRAEIGSARRREQTPPAVPSTAQGAPSAPGN